MFGILFILEIETVTGWAYIGTGTASDASELLFEPKIQVVEGGSGFFYYFLVVK